MAVVQENLSPVEKKLKAWRPNEDVPGWFSKMRGEARDAYFDLPLPTRKDEAWHYGNPRRFQLTGLDIAHAQPGFNGHNYERICGLTNQPGRVACLSMVSDKVAEISSSTPLRDAGVTIMSLRQALALRGDLIEPFWTKPLFPLATDQLVAGHFALVDNGFFIHIPRNIEAPEAIHLILESGEPGSVVSPHILIIAEAFTKADIFVHFIGDDCAERNLQLGVIQVHVGDGANLTLTKMQNLGRRTDAFTREASELGRDATYRSTAVHFGGFNVRHELICNLPNPGANAQLYAMHFANGRQTYDFYTQQNHHAPNTTSKLLFKGALGGRAKSSYLGKIDVAANANNTDAYQTNRTLLLSDEARTNSSPQLEIDNHEVVCSHGSTTSNIREDELFYLQSRGLPAEQARRLLVSGFLAEIADQIPLSTVRDYAYNYVLERFN